ncbi:hypothetical protein SAMN05216257_102525 [Meinhardsimonia xiamenensis]|jgi:hypothetical protein|uniref:Uncharacterized protein n=1 Tax=Meinhardsimonia xiamenensis TaxID=990712 RepID=A0A1G9BF92_9RHOB|nr:hypothetical protein [Meinhardsimonia xiamenensis]PRX35001.1 hypothetical protein LV81_01594 [Meinhardsimonia xiamenensis]SDK38189.1 hypothetical protein SAMN05216257_102525 [Meinhardsimonia xiamenensis]
MWRWIPALLVAPAGVLAGEPASPPPHAVTATAAPEVRPLPPPDYPIYEGLDYSCTDAEGNRVPLGTVACFTASCQTWTARCELSLTNVIWRKLQDGCPGV